MDRRSWYMPNGTAELLSQTVDDLHWKTRQPKHEILAALVETAVRNIDQATEILLSKDSAVFSPEKTRTSLPTDLPAASQAILSRYLGKDFDNQV